MGSMVENKGGVFEPASGLAGKVTPVNPDSPPVPQSMLPAGMTNAQPQIRYGGMADGPGSQGNGPGITALQSRPIAKPQTQTQMLSQSPQIKQTLMANKFAALKQNNPTKYNELVKTIRDRQGKAKGGRVGYADGSQPQINQQQVAMIVTMLKKGADLDTIASVTGVPAQAIQMIVSKLQQNIQQRAKGGIAEIDYRDKGGYVPPIGKKERADDIPAMLSNNEFVFTANAVRNAGGGDVKEGAKKMYALMKKLEGKK
jgi:hypothetical protein